MDKPTPEDITIPSDAELMASGSGLDPHLDGPRSGGFPPQLWALWERRALVRRAFFYALVLGLAVAVLIPSQYTSKTRIMPPDDQQGSAAIMAAMMGKSESSGGGMGALAGSLLGGKTTGALYVDLLHSRTVQDRIVERFELQKEYWKRYRGDAIAKLDGRTSVEEDRKSGVISISVSDGNRERARQLAAAYVDELNRLLAEVSTSAARRERMFVEQRLASVSQDLESAEKELSEFSSKNSVLDMTEQTKAMVESAAMLQAQLIAAQSELQGLQQIYTPDNVRVRSAQARVSELRRHLQTMGGTGAPGEPGAAEASPELYPSLRKLPLLGVKWVDLYRRAKVEETLYELLTKQYELARIQEAKEIPTIKVVDPANVPERKSFPPRLLIILLFALTGVAGAVAWIMLSPAWEKLPPEDPRKRIVHDVRHQLASGWRQRKLLRPFKENGLHE